MVNPLPPLDHGILLQWAFGALVVSLYARDRFDSPQSTRATTTFTRYWVARLGYIASMLALFLVLGGALGDVDLAALWNFLQVPAAVKNAERMPGPLVAALLLTSMLPSFPFLTRIDETVKKWFQRVGNIPFEARLLSGQLQNANFQPSTDMLVRIEPQLADLGVDPAWLADSPSTVRYRWSRAAVLWMLVQDWTKARGYSRYVTQRKTQYDEICARLESLAPMLDEVSLRVIESPANARSAKALQRKVRKDVDQLHEAVCDFVSSGVLDREWNLSQRNTALARLGFSGLPDARGSLSLNEVALVAGLIFLAMVLAALIARRFFDPTPLAPNLRVLVMVPIIYTVAIVVALYPKAAWAFADVQRVGHRPYAAYLLSGVIAAAAAFMISLLFRYLFEDAGNLLVALSQPGRFDKAFTATAERWPWLLMPLLNTIAIAFTADNWAMHPELVRGRLRIYESLGLAACFAMFQWIVVQLLAQATTFGPRWFDEELRLVVTAAVIGACVGYLVPHLHRKRLQAEPAQSAVMPQVRAA
jgi:hypothetical protein